MTLAEPGFLIVEDYAVEQMPHSVGTGTDIVGMDVNGTFAAGFLKARACAGHNGSADSEGFDDRKSETLVTRSVQRHFGTRIQCREVGQGHILQMHDAAGEAETLYLAAHTVGICAFHRADNHEFNPFGELGEGTYREKLILTRLDSADRYYIALGQFLFLSHLHALSSADGK